MKTYVRPEDAAPRKPEPLKPFEYVKSDWFGSGNPKQRDRGFRAAIRAFFEAL